MNADVGYEMVPIDEVVLRCRIDGRDGAPWLLLSNSLMTNLSLWEAQVATWGERFRILRYDQRGHGGSTVPADPVTINCLVEDARALLDHFGITRAVVGGVSMGATTALGLAARHPDRVLGVIASDGQSRTAPGGKAMWRERIAFAREQGMEAVVQASLPRWFRPSFLERGGPDLDRALAMMRGTSLDGYAACATALTGYDLDAELPAIRVPVLLVAGAQDGAMPATMRAMRERIPDARFLEVAEAGHLPNLEQPAAFNALAGPFLAGLLASDPARP
ncbi:MAG: alpha/beta fold hydrolase [Janthinobacterium lividum]